MGPGPLIAWGLARPIKESSRTGHPGLGFCWPPPPRAVRPSAPAQPSLVLHRSTAINIYQSYAILSSNIWWHTSSQHGNQRLGFFFPLSLLLNPRGLLPHPPSAAPPPWQVVPPPGVMRHRLQWLTTITHDTRDADDGSATAAAVAAVVVPAATPPSAALTATMATPRGPSTLTTGLTQFRCGLVPGGDV
jgi:hypothetical protein